jgi:hypothetical protein
MQLHPHPSYHRRATKPKFLMTHAPHVRSCKKMKYKAADFKLLDEDEQNTCLAHCEQATNRLIA